VAKTNYFRVLAILTAMIAAALVGVLMSHAPAKAATAQDTLKQPPFAPTDTSLFDPATYSDAPALQPASSGPTYEATLRQKLSDLLNQRFPNSSDTVSKALTMFDSQSTKAIVPDPRLRAALVALKGTVGEPAINGVLNSFSTVHFGTLPSNAIAQVQAPPPGSDLPQIVVNESFQFEDFRLIAPVFAHEALHQDPTVSNKEELIANAIEGLVTGQFWLENPDLATSGTELARLENTELMARINTRDAEGNLRLLTSQGNIFPGGTFTPYFAAPFEPFGDSTPGNRVLKGELRKVVPAKKVPRKPHFNDKTVLLLDKYQKVFTATEVVQLAEILLLDTAPPSPAIQAQRAQEEATASEQPVPDWQEIFGAQ
jgi:hypothetical protein